MSEGRRGRLTDLAYTYVRQGILDGRLTVGSVLAESELAAEIGISRTPVRHALSQLLQEGLVEVGARRQLLVRGFTDGHRAEILMLRQALEGVSVRRACDVMELEELDALRLNLLRQRRAAREGRENDFIDLDEEFHLGIAEGAQLPLLEGFLRQLREFVRVARLGSSRPPLILERVVAEHEAILDAVEARRPDAAHLALIDHLARSDYAIAELAGVAGEAS